MANDQKYEKDVVPNGGKLELSVAAACFRKASTTAAWSSIDIYSRMVGGIVFSGLELLDSAGGSGWHWLMPSHPGGP